MNVVILFKLNFNLIARNIADFRKKTAVNCQFCIAQITLT